MAVDVVTEEFLKEYMPEDRSNYVPTEDNEERVSWQIKFVQYMHDTLQEELIISSRMANEIYFG